MKILTMGWFKGRWIPAFAGMTLDLGAGMTLGGVARCVMLGAFLVVAPFHPALADGDETPPGSSLFLTPSEVWEAEMLAQKLAPPGHGDIHLGAVIYFGPDDWTVWLQNEKWTPETARDDLQILDVTADGVNLLWHGEDGEQEIALKPYQTYRVTARKVTGL